MRVLRYMRQHHVGLLALLIALGGTSYAAVSLPPNSVGTKQLRNRAVTPKKLAPKTRKALRGRPGRPGARGVTGPRGTTGVRGATGATGPPGPTSGAAAATSTLSGFPAGSGTFSATTQTATVQLTHTGAVLVLITGSFSVTCDASGACIRDVGAAMGTPGTSGFRDVPGTVFSLAAGSSGSDNLTVTLAGIVTGVSPGTHDVRIWSRRTAHAVPTTDGPNVRIAAIALG